jgi:V8-like Glu-specific endopeptidase
MQAPTIAISVSDAREPIGHADGAIDRAIVGPSDSRVQVLDTLRYPFNIICHLGRDFGDGRLRGCSGVLVAPRLVLTAGHCLFSLKRGRAPRRILVSPGRRSRRERPFGAMFAGACYAPRRFLGPTSPAPVRRASDYGFIVLPRAFPRINRYMPVGAASDAALARLCRGARVGIAGYPGDRPAGTMWFHRERLVGFDTKGLRYTVDTCPGHSGAPVWAESAPRRNIQVVGVHTSGIVDRLGRSRGCQPDTVPAPPGSFNSGVRVNAAIAQLARHPSPAAFAALGMVRMRLLSAGSGGW